MSNSSPRTRRWLAPTLLSALVLAVVATLAVAAFRTRAVQVAYHDWRMSRSREAFFNQPGENIKGLRALTHDDHHAAYVYHRDRLVDLGAVTRHHFVLVHLVRPSAEAQHFIKWLMPRTEPKCIDWTSPVEPDAPLSITLWCYPAQSKEWQDLMQDHDIPDYANVFMKDSDS